MKKLFNYFILLTLVLAFSFLISRIVLERLPRSLIGFCCFYIFFGLLAILIPILINIIRNRQASSKVSFFSQIKSSCELLFLKVFNSIKKIVIQDFFWNFLEKKKSYKMFFFFVIKTFEKLIIFNKFCLIVIIIIPWIIFVGFFLYESITKNFFLVSLYILSFNFLLKTIFRVVLFINKEHLLGLANLELLIYLDKLLKDEEAKNYFLSTSKMKSLFFFSVKEVRSKDLFIFFWELFTKVHHFYNLRFSLDILEFQFIELQKFLRKINLIIFTTTLIFFTVSNFAVQQIFYFFISIFSFSLIIFFVMDFLKILKDPYLLEKETLILAINNSFIRMKKDILLTFSFVVNEDLPYPYINKKSYKQMFSESLELQSLIQENSKNDFQGFSEFSQLTFFKLNENQMKLVKQAEELVLIWYYQKVLASSNYFNRNA